MVKDLPFRQSDMFFVVGVVMFAVTLPTITSAVMAISSAVLLWIRFCVYGGRDQ